MTRIRCQQGPLPLIAALSVLCPPFAAWAQVPADLLNNLSPAQIDQMRQMPPGELEKLRNKVERPIAQPLNALPSAPRQGAEQIEGRVKASGERAKLTEVAGDKVIDTQTAPPKQYGYDLFEGVATTFAPVTDIPITADYLIGPGDTVIVNYLGARNEQYSLIVNREGQLTLPGIGQVVVSGMTFESMSMMLLERVEKQMIGVKASVTMGPLRSIRVFILGEANRPGSYTVSALSTITNALFVSGGVKSIGSLRKIELRRGNKTIRHLDLYDLLMRGDTQGDERLQPGDVIFIPKIGPTATVIGEVLRPAIYELKGEKTAQELLELSGGLLPGAYPQTSQMERVDNHQHKTLVDVNLSEAKGKRIAIQDGDVLRVYSVLDKLEKVVLLSGHVARQGGLQWRPGMRLTDLVTGYDDLLPKPDMRYAIVKRELPPDRRIQVLSVDLGRALADKQSSANIELQARDELIVFPSETPRTALLTPLIGLLRNQERRNEPARIVSAFGYMRFPGSYPYEEGMTLHRLLQAAADDRPRADLNRVLLVRQDPTTRAISTHLIDVSAQQQLEYKLQAGDELYVFNQDEDKSRAGTTPAATESPPPTASARTPLVSSATKTSATENETKVATELQARQTLLDSVLQRLRQQARSGQLAKVVSISGPVMFPGDYPLTQSMKISDLIAFSGKFRENAYVLEGELSRVELLDGKLRSVNHRSIDLAAIARGESAHDVELRPYDSLIIRPIPGWEETALVEIAGRVRFPGQYAIKRGEKLSHLVQRAGGLIDYAAPEAAVFTRKTLQTKERESMELLAQRLESEIAAVTVRSSNTPTNVTGAAAPQAQASMLESLSKRIRSTQAIGRLAIDLPRIIDEVNSKNASPQDVTLEPGDRLFIPVIQESISVVGEVNFPVSLRYEDGLSLGDYIDSAGGATQNADEDSIYVIRANGKVQTSNHSSWLIGSSPKIRPGDTIVVPMDIKQVAPVALWTSVSQIFSNLAVSLAALKTIGIAK